MTELFPTATGGPKTNWSRAEIAYLREHAPEGATALAVVLRRSVWTIRNRAARLGLDLGRDPPGTGVPAANRLDGEEWRAVEGWPYEVSSFGRARRVDGCLTKASKRLDGGLLSPAPNPKTGYPVVTLKLPRRTLSAFLHALVCAAFHGPRPEGQQVRHLDGVRTNCRADNLAWGTVSENIEDKRAHGTLPIGDSHGMTKISDAQYACMLADWQDFPKGRGCKTAFARYAVGKYGATESIALDAIRGRPRAQRIIADKGREYLGGSHD